MTRPNFLFFITDQHRVDYLGCYGHPVLKTPNINSIAARGTRFERFYVATPVCMPNRATLMTGRMPSVHGVRSNGSPLSLQSNTFVDALRASGYATALVGKSHLQNFSDIPATLKRPPPRPGDQVLDAELSPRRGSRRPPTGPMTRSIPSAGRRVATSTCGCRSTASSTSICARRTATRSAAITTSGSSRSGPTPTRCATARTSCRTITSVRRPIARPIPEELYPTVLYRRQKLRVARPLCRRRDRSQPFFLMASFPDPHHPFTPPGRYWSMYRPQDMALPASFHHGNRPLARPVAWALAQRESGKAVVTEQAAFAVDEREAREAMALSCGMIAMIDDAVGRILAQLAARGLADDTIVIFTTDHGDFLGDHRLLLKGPAHYDGITHVPFIWAEPGTRPSRRTDVLGGTLDIAATILDRARIQPYNGIQGESLLPAIIGEGARHARTRW